MHIGDVLNLFIPSAQRVLPFPYNIEAPFFFSCHNVLNLQEFENL